MKKIFIVFFILTVLSVPAFSANTIYVNGNNVGLADGTLSRPFPKIQDAIDEAEDAQKIYIYPGTYRENLEIQNKAVFLQGAGPQSVSLIAPTAFPAISLYYSEGGSVTNMTISHDTGVGDGVRMYHSSGHIEKNVFKDNQVAVNVQYRSAGIFVEKNIFYDNYIGVRSNESYFRIQNNLFYKHSGPVLQIQNESLVHINNNLLIYNDDYALQIKNASAQVLNNTIAYNQLGIEVDLFAEGDVDILNNIIAFNNSYGLNVSVLNKEALLVDYNNFYENGLARTGIDQGPHDISANPEFIRPSLRTFNSFRLAGHSPCRDRGTTDRFQRDQNNSRNDIGFTGGPDAYWYYKGY